MDKHNDVSIIYDMKVLGKEVWVKFFIDAVTNEGENEAEKVAHFYKGVIIKMEVSYQDDDPRQTLEYRHFIRFGDADDGYYDLTDLEDAGSLYWNGKDAHLALESDKKNHNTPSASQSNHTPSSAAKPSSPSRGRNQGSAVVTPVKRNAGSSMMTAPMSSSKQHKVKTEPIAPNPHSGISNYTTDPVNDTINMDQFQHWLGTVHKGSKGDPISNANFKCVLSRARNLISGDGITYVNWPQGIKFNGHNTRNSDPVVDLTTDYAVLLSEAKDQESRYGKDKGNGWLLQHPIKKLMLYQQYVKQLRQQSNPIYLD